MGALYYMGTHSGTSKKTGNPYWAVNIFRLNRFNNYEITSFFVEKTVYSDVNSLSLPLGVPVSLTVDIDGRLTDLKRSAEYKALELEARAPVTFVKPANPNQTHSKE